MNGEQFAEIDAGPMQVHVTHHCVENRGDHAAEVVYAHQYDPDETVSDLLMRVLNLPVKKWGRAHDPSEFVTLRLVVGGTEPKEADDGSPPF